MLRTIIAPLSQLLRAILTLPARLAGALIFPAEPQDSNRGTPTSVDLDAYLSRRVVPIVGTLDEQSAVNVVAQILFLRSIAPSEPLTIEISSWGGQLSAGLAIVDVMDECPELTYTHCVDFAGGVAVLVLASGGPGHRSIAPMAEIRLAPLEAASGAEAESEELRRCSTILFAALRQRTGQELLALEVDCNSRRLLDATEAVRYGIADLVVPADGTAQQRVAADGPGGYAPGDRS